MKYVLFQIRNLQDDSSYFGISDDTEGFAAAERFKLDLGMHQCAQLQEAYSKIGLELFVIEELKESDDKEELARLREELASTLTAKGITVFQSRA